METDSHGETLSKLDAAAESAAEIPPRLLPRNDVPTAEITSEYALKKWERELKANIYRHIDARCYRTAASTYTGCWRSAGMAWRETFLLDRSPSIGQAPGLTTYIA
ncbi:hypothetical protein Bbelb_219450 [Branchiostoma belcheri]|nr:hypothetical protein Bbelb_219450 [Branchiostoma belcheri]